MKTDANWEDMYRQLRSLIITDGYGLIGDARNEFKDSDSPDWRSFFRGWTQGRIDIVQKVFDFEKKNGLNI